MSPALIRSQALEVGYAAKPLLPVIDTEIERGAFFFVLGRNGSGKTTFFRTLLHLLPPVRGTVVHADGLRVAYIPQRTSFDPIYPLSAGDVIAMGAIQGASFLKPLGPAKRAIAEAMEVTGTTSLAGSSFRSLSEGQKQRVLFARALVTRPDIAFLDEPTAAMDVVSERDMMILVDRVRKERDMAVVMVTHELSLATELADRVLFVDRALKVALSGTPAEVFGHPEFARLYGKERAADLVHEIAIFHQGKPS